MSIWTALCLIVIVGLLAYAIGFITPIMLDHVVVLHCTESTAKNPPSAKYPLGIALVKYKDEWFRLEKLKAPLE